MEWKITQDDSGSRLLTFLKEKLGPGYSTKTLKRALEHNLCLVNNRIERFGTYRLGKGDIVSFRSEDLQGLLQTENRQTSLSVIYEDEFLLFIDKPPGIVSNSSLSQEILLHRLDRETSGALGFAKTPESAKAMLGLFKMREIEKQYFAIVDGRVEKRSGRIENYLGKLHAYGQQTLWGEVPKSKGQLAITEWKLIQKGKDCSWVECYPVTGRTHQIRIHMSDMGHPILGDKIYGKRFTCSHRPKRMLLHAKSLHFVHPMTKKKMIVEAPLPADFEEMIRKMTHAAPL